MNILPKKKWHVRTKENVARVRRDQKKAAEEAQRVMERAQAAEQEFKLNILRQNAGDRVFDSYGARPKESDRSGDSSLGEHPSGHVNFFADLEAEERKNLGTTNKDYEEEKRKEVREHESKLGIMKYLGEGSNELTKQSAWYEQIPLQRGEGSSKTDVAKLPPLHVGVSAEKDNNSKSSGAEGKIKKKKKKEKEKRKRRHHTEDTGRRRKHRRRSEASSLNEAEGTAAPSGSSGNSGRTDPIVEKLRMERVQREEEERRRTFELLNPRSDDKNKDLLPSQRYSSQFNPEIARQNRPRPTEARSLR